MLASRPFTLERLSELYLRAEESTCNVFWRHDVDFSLDAALKLARFEAEREIFSTYYLFDDERWPFYTIYDACIVAERLRDIGHETGVHLNERWIVTPDHLAAYDDVKASFHCPTEKVLWQEFPFFKDYAYAPKWEGHYCADSRGIFAYSDPEDMLHLYNLQANLHPEHWFARGWEDEVDSETYREFFYEDKP